MARAPHGVSFSLVDQTRGGTTREPRSQGALAWAIPKGVRDAERLSPISLRASFALSQVVSTSRRYLYPLPNTFILGIALWPGG